MITREAAALVATPAGGALWLAVDVGLMVLAWLVQLVVYPAFASIDRARFLRWHAGYTRRISLVVAPLMVGQAALHGLAFWWRPTLTGGGQLVLVAAAWLITVFLAVPCHRRLGTEGCRPFLLRRLILAQSLRTAIWSLLAVATALRVLTR